jgi:hypothetical protein
MATVLEECAIEDRRSLVRFLWAKGHSVKDSEEGLSSTELVTFKWNCNMSSGIHTACGRCSGLLVRGAEVGGEA